MGKVYKYGDNVDTDVIIPARYLNEFDGDELKKHCMFDIDERFNEVVKPGDFIVGGENFGCGSSREHAPLAIKSSGVKAVIAKSFARIFYRNSFNIGMPILESAEAVDSIENGDEIEVDFSTGEIRNITRNETYHANPIPDFMQKLVDDGGLVQYVKNK